MNAFDRAVVLAIKGIVHVMCRVDPAPLAAIPATGPLILVTNHVNFLEIPVLYPYLLPRPLAALIKTESWDNPVLRYLFNFGGGIPLRRGEADMGALRKGLAALDEDKILVVSPEGTRSGHGRLLPGHPGVVLLALHSGVPILPIVQYGHERIWSNLKRLRRTDYHIAVGKPFALDTGGARATRRIRQQMMNELMYQMATLLPVPYRGHYADLSAMTTEYLWFL